MDARERKNYERKIASIRSELDKLPKGRLVKRGTTFYHKTTDWEKGITRQLQVIKQLARKAFLLKQLKNLEHNFSIIQRQCRQRKAENPMEIINELSSFYQELPFDYFFHPLTSNWSSQVPAKNPIHPEALIYSTKAGLLGRSKSERTIAESLDQNKIPYRYEEARSFGRTTKYPDFSILRPLDGTLILWEHFGLMDQDKYRHHATETITLYAQHGFFPMNNLICTYEKDLRNTAQIQAIIEVYLL